MRITVLEYGVPRMVLRIRIRVQVQVVLLYVPRYSIGA